MVKISQPAPKFNLDAYHEDKEIKVSIDDYKGKWVAIVFYPADFTFICPTELGELADYYEEFQKLNTEVLVVSTDKVFTHKAWHDVSDTIKKIKFPMIADPTGNMCRDYGVLIEEAGEALRGSFIVDPEGLLVSYEVNNNDIGRSSAELVRKLQAAQFVREHGEVCPASWKPGGKTLKKGMDLVGKL